MPQNKSKSPLQVTAQSLFLFLFIPLRDSPNNFKGLFSEGEKRGASSETGFFFLLKVLLFVGVSIILVVYEIRDFLFERLNRSNDPPPPPPLCSCSLLSLSLFLDFHCFPHALPFCKNLFLRGGRSLNSRHLSAH